MGFRSSAGGTWTLWHLVIEAVSVATSAAFEDFYDVGVVSFGKDFEYQRGISPKIMYSMSSVFSSCPHATPAVILATLIISAEPPRGYGDEELFLPKCTIIDN